MLSVGFDRLARLVASTEKFIEITASLTEEEALAHVLVPQAFDFIAKLQADEPSTPGTKQHGLPRAIVNPTEGYEYIPVSLHGNRFHGMAELTLEIQIPDDLLTGVADADRMHTELMYAVDVFDTIVKQMMDLRGRGESVPGETHLNVTRMSAVAGPYYEFAEETELDEPGQPENKWWQTWAVEWSN
jgi:hypothetical protein